MKKRLLCIFLVLAMILAMIPAVQAKDTNDKLAEKLAQIDPSNAATLEVSCSETTLGNTLKNTKASANAIMPSINMIGQNAVAGQTMILEFSLFSYGGYGQSYNSWIFYGNEIEEENLVATCAGSFSTSVAITELDITWDTSGLRPGDYLVVSFTDYYGEIVGTVYDCTVTLTSYSTALQGIHLMDVNNGYAVTNSVYMSPNAEGEYIVGYSPLNATTPDRSTTVFSSNSSVASVSIITGVITVSAKNCGTTTIAVSSAGKTTNLYVTVHKDIDGDFLCDYCGNLCFTDTPTSAWYYGAVAYAVQNGLMNGMGNNLFQPDGPMTRAQLVTVLWRYEGSPVQGSNTFTDVANGMWYTQAIAWASYNGIVGGVGNNRFNPDGTITREQLSTILYRYSNSKGFNTAGRADLSSFPDSGSVGSWAADSMQWAVHNSLIGGTSIGGVAHLDPQGSATRAQVSTILMRYIESIPGTSGEYRVALITDYGTVNDQSFNQAVYEAAKEWCLANGVNFSYYRPTGDSTEERVAAAEEAIADGYNVLLFPGFLFGNVLVEMQNNYPNVKFIALDVGEGDMTHDYSTFYEPSANSVCITYKEEQAGYLAGYAAVKMGYRELGFVGGMPVPAVIQYGYGFIQGANAAAVELGIADQVEVNFVYANQFYGDADITAYVDGLYYSGTEVIFACGGGVFTSVGEAAAVCGGKVIGLDVDQAATIDGLYGEGITVTSAMKGLGYSTQLMLDALKNGNWSAYSGRFVELGTQGSATNGSIMLPDSTQFNSSFTQADYVALWDKLANGSITVSDATDTAPYVSITVNYLGNIK